MTSRNYMSGALMLAGENSFSSHIRGRGDGVQQSGTGRGLLAVPSATRQIMRRATDCIETL